VGLCPGSWVTVMGREGNTSPAIWADTLAEKTGTIPYEILCNLGSRIPHVYT